MARSDTDWIPAFAGMTSQVPIAITVVIPAKAGIQNKAIQGMKTFCVYILANRRNGTLYIGVTSDLLGRVWQHKNKVVAGFTAKYGVDKLVYYESHESAEEAIRRERRIKKWNRRWKLELIESTNPDWRDLYLDLTV